MLVNRARFPAVAFMSSRALRSHRTFASRIFNAETCWGVEMHRIEARAKLTYPFSVTTRVSGVRQRRSARSAVGGDRFV